MHAARPRREHALALGVICVAVLLAHATVALGFESYYHADRYYLHTPFWHGAWASIARGDFPFWTHAIRGGYPLFANGEASLAYPFTWLFLPFFEAHRALDWFTLFHLVLGGFFCWLYLRDLLDDFLLALVGAIAFALSGRLTGTTIWAHAVAATAWLPLLLWAVDRRSLVVLALATGLGALTGRPQIHVLSLMIAAAYAALRLSQSWRGRDAIAIAGGFATGIGLACIQVLPTLAFVQVSSRADGTHFPEWIGFALGPQHLTHMLLPGSFPAGWPEAKCYPTLFVYVGLGIALFQLCRRRVSRPVEVIFWLLLTALALYVAFGGPGVYTVMQQFPFFRSYRVPARFAGVAAFAVLVIASLGWRRLLAQRHVWCWIVFGLTLLDGGIATILGRHTVTADAYRITHRFVEPLKDVEPDESGAPRRFHADHQWHRPEELVGYEDAQIVAAFADIAPCRNLAMRYGLRHAQGYGQPTFYWVPDGREHCTHNNFRQLGIAFAFLSHEMEHPGWEEFPSGSASWHAYRVLGALPRANVYYETVRGDTAKHAFHISSADDFESEKKVAVADDLPSLTASNVRHVQLMEERANEVRWSVMTDRPGYLVVFDTFAPGWTATVGSTPVEIRRANGTFRLVPVPAGKHEVTFRYWPPGFRLGLCLTVLAGLVLCVLAWRARRST